MSWFTIILFFILLALSFFTPIFAQTRKTCVDNETLQINTSKTIIIKENDTETTKEETIIENLYCPGGCENDNCKPLTVYSDYIFNLPTYSIFLGFSLLMYLISNKYPTLNLISSLLLLVLSVYVLLYGIQFNELIYRNNLTITLGIIGIGISLYMMIATIWR